MATVPCPSSSLPSSSPASPPPPPQVANSIAPLLPFCPIEQRYSGSTDDANKGIEVNYTEDNIDGQSNTSRILRRMHTQQEANMLVDLAEESEEMYKFIISELIHTHKSAIAMNTNSLIGDETRLLESSQNLQHTCITEQGNEAPQLPIGDPQISKTKGRKKDGEKVAQNCRFKSGLEVSLSKSLVKRKSCHECGGHGHNSRTCKKRNQND
ncbi:Zinc finger, CCHC-type [Sesbania bispinosa]|nr:Zinc finger, CCHC-type [Sesbania bispinosa]